MTGADGTESKYFGFVWLLGNVEGREARFEVGG